MGYQPVTLPRSYKEIAARIMEKLGATPEGRDDMRRGWKEEGLFAVEHWVAQCYPGNYRRLGYYSFVLRSLRPMFLATDGRDLWDAPTQKVA